MQGNPRAIFKRAIERGNVVVAEMTARELGRLSLDESLALTGETTPGNEAEAARPARPLPRASGHGGAGLGRPAPAAVEKLSHDPDGRIRERIGHHLDPAPIRLSRTAELVDHLKGRDPIGRFATRRSKPIARLGCTSFSTLSPGL